MKKIKLVNMVAIHFLEKIYQEFCFLICKFTTIFTLKIFLKKKSQAKARFSMEICFIKELISMV